MSDHATMIPQIEAKFNTFDLVIALLVYNGQNSADEVKQMMMT